MRLSNVAFENNANLGGSTGLVVRDPSCHDEVELRDVAFEGNKYLNGSVLARENTLSNVSVVANRRIANTNNRRTSFFHFPADSSSTVTNMTAKDNANAHVLYVEGGNLNVSFSLFHNNTGKWSALVRAISSSLTMHETRFLNNSRKTGFIAVTAEKASSVYFSSCTFAGNVGGGKSRGIVFVSAPYETSFLFCDFIENIVSSSVGSTVLLKGSGRPVNKKTRQRKSTELVHCKFLTNKSFHTTAVRIAKFYDQTALFDSCELRNNRMLDTWDDMMLSSLSAAIKLEDSYVQNFTTKNCTFHSNSDTSYVLLLSSVYGTFWIRNTFFSDNRASLSWGTGVLSVQRRSSARVPSWAKTVSNKKAILNVEDSDFKGDGKLFAGSAVLISDEQMRVKLRNNRFQDNWADKGAAVCVEKTHSVLVDNCTFMQNRAKNGGGAIRIESSASFDVSVIRNSAFTRNEGQYGGAIDASTDIRVRDSHFRENRASARGGAINIKCLSDDGLGYVCNLYVQRSTFTENWAVRSGGALQVGARSVLTATSCGFYENEATFGGGISLFRDQSYLRQVLNDSRLTQNNAKIGGEITDSLTVSECRWMQEPFRC